MQSGGGLQKVPIQLLAINLFGFDELDILQNSAFSILLRNKIMAVKKEANIRQKILHEDNYVYKRLNLSIVFCF